MSFFKFPVYDFPGDSKLPTNQGIKSTIIFVDEAHFGKEEQSLLQKIIGATGKTIDDIDIVRCSNPHKYYPYISAHMDGLIISFGLSPVDLGLQTDPTLYRLIKIGKRSFLFSDHLSELKSNAEMKKALWSNLKNYFKI